MATFLAYSLTGTAFDTDLAIPGGEGSTTGGTAYGIAGQDGTGSPTILGDGTNTFSFNGTVFTYEGTAYIGSAPGFVAENAGHFYFFAPQNPAVFTPPGTATNISSPYYPDPGSTTTATNGEYNVALGADGCFLGEVLIRTPQGDRAVRDLRAGDEVITADGDVRSIRWVGTSVKAVPFSDPIATLPVCIRAGALGPETPQADLRVSPGHGVLVDGVLVNAGSLVNGSSIVRDEAVAGVFAYFHLELDSHDLLVANGVPAESFLEANGDLSMDNMAERADLPGSAPSVEMPYPRAKSPRQIPSAIRERLRELCQPSGLSEAIAA